MEGPRITVNIVNLSKDSVYVDPMGDTCDTCEIMRDVRQYCGHTPWVFYKKLSPDDSTIVAVPKDYGPLKILVINVDSLKDYRSKRYMYNITNKKWVKIIVNDKINENTKECTFTIN